MYSASQKTRIKIQNTCYGSPVNLLWNLFITHSFNLGARGGVVVKVLRYKPASRGSIPDSVIGIVQWQSFRSHYDPGVDSASNKNEYQVYFLGVKATGA